MWEKCRKFNENSKDKQKPSGIWKTVFCGKKRGENGKSLKLLKWDYSRRFNKVTKTTVKKMLSECKKMLSECEDGIEKWNPMLEEYTAKKQQIGDNICRRKLNEIRVLIQDIKKITFKSEDEISQLMNLKKQYKELILSLDIKSITDIVDEKKNVLDAKKLAAVLFVRDLDWTRLIYVIRILLKREWQNCKENENPDLFLRDISLAQLLFIYIKYKLGDNMKSLVEIFNGDKAMVKRLGTMCEFYKKAEKVLIEDQGCDANYFWLANDVKSIAQELSENERMAICKPLNEKKEDEIQRAIKQDIPKNIKEAIDLLPRL